jgi:ABC-2 type transport system permease protein
MNLYGFFALFYKELLRFKKVALQTLVAPVVTALLYLMVFSHVLQERVSVYSGVGYSAFLVPGLIMMSIIQNAFANSSSSLIQSKVTGNLVFVLLSPLSPLEFFLAFMLAAAVRGMLVAATMYIVAVFFVPLPMYSPGVLLVFAFLASGVLGSLGIIAGIWANKFDHVATFQNFFIMPMSFLSGVFFSIHSLSVFLHDRRLPLRLPRGIRCQPGAQPADRDRGVSCPGGADHGVVADRLPPQGLTERELGSMPDAVIGRRYPHRFTCPAVTGGVRGRDRAPPG